MIPLRTSDGFVLWVSRAHIILVFDDPDTDAAQEAGHVALVKLTPGAMVSKALMAVTQSAAEVKHLVWQSQFDEITTPAA